MNKYVDVIIPLALVDTYVYLVPNQFLRGLAIGMRVVVPFGNKQSYCAVIRRIHQNKPDDYVAKSIEAVIDHSQIISETHIQFWEWMANYYVCTIGEVMNAALPAGLKINHSDSILLNQSKKYDKSALSDNQFVVVDALELNTSLKIEEVEDIVTRKSAQEVVNSLINLDIVQPKRAIYERYTPKLKAFIVLNKSLVNSEEKLEIRLKELSKAPRQTKVLMSFLHLSNHYDGKINEVSKEELMMDSGASSGTLHQLVKKGILEVYQKELDRIINSQTLNLELQELSVAQQQAYNEINDSFMEHRTVLLHGVTSSGKTEVYMKLIQEALDQDMQVLYLVPEIGLTTQLTNRLASYFQKRLGVYHSKFNANEKVEIWK
ncbi:MAG: DEAD/DEAH box helicase family protein, partial [Bacteroidetes bacterium]|nr:DEAD/DEAH box helicase family protein [Bacteroidota bacterium]